MSVPILTVSCVSLPCGVNGAPQTAGKIRSAKLQQPTRKVCQLQSQPAYIYENVVRKTFFYGDYMAAKNWQEFIDNYDGYLTSPEMHLIEEVWEAALKAVEENGSSHNKQSTPCNHTLDHIAIVSHYTCTQCGRSWGVVSD